MEQRLCRLMLLLAAVSSARAQVFNRIVGGQDGNIMDFPWQVSIRFGSQHACGGSLLSDVWVLTAAHCFPSDHSIDSYDVLCGSTSLTNPDAGAQSVLVDSVSINPSYTPDSNTADIALVKLKSPVSFSASLSPVRLPSANVQLPAGLDCKIAGWGYTRPSVPLVSPQTLQVAQVELMSRKTCGCLYNINPGKDTLTFIPLDMICAGTADGSVDACQGDSGGPLTCNTNGNTYQVGVVSWGEECGAKNRPGVYTMVPVYVDWIKSIVSNAQVDSFTVEATAEPDNEGGCRGADGQLYPYPNSASVVLVTLGMLPLYWLTAYFLTDL